MSIDKSKYLDNNLRTGQLEILKLLFKYRFVSRLLLQQSLGLSSGSALHKKLEILIKHEYIGKRVEKRLKLEGVPNAYHLLPNGMRALQALEDYKFINRHHIQSTYNDQRVTFSHIIHILDVYKCSQQLTITYPNLKIFTKRDMSQYSFFPKQAPDAFLSLPQSGDTKPVRYWLDIIPAKMPRYEFDRILKGYVTFFEKGGWDKTNSPLPVLLFLAENGTTEKRIRNSMIRMYDTFAIDLDIRTSTMNAVSQNQEKIWTNLDDSDTLMGLG